MKRSVMFLACFLFAITAYAEPALISVSEIATELSEQGGSAGTSYRATRSDIVEQLKDCDLKPNEIEQMICLLYVVTKNGAEFKHGCAVVFYLTDDEWTTGAAVADWTSADLDLFDSDADMTTETVRLFHNRQVDKRILFQAAKHSEAIARESHSNVDKVISED